ncbi:MAG TPA: hypothetical protein VIV09_16215 [Pseudolabrys sp.]
MHFADALEKWHDFYVLLGTGAAALVALLFVAVSLGAGFLNEERAEATRTFFSPIVVHFGAAFFLACITLVPGHRAEFFAVLIGAAGLVGLCVSAYTTVKFFARYRTPYLSDHLAYVAMPAIAYLALLVAAALAYAGRDGALDVLAGALLVLLLVNIRNAWDLMLSMVRRHAEAANKPPDAPPTA